MKAIVKGTDLANAILKVSKAVSTKTPNQILEGIKFSLKGDTLVLFATDLEISIEKTIKAETFMEGETVVPGRLFSEFVKKLENEDDIELNTSDEGKLIVTYSSAECAFQTFNANDFPINKKEINQNSFTIKQKDFRDIINKTAFSCSQDDSRPILKGCLLEVENDLMSLVALDGFRLALCKNRIKDVFGVVKAIIPARALVEITRLIENDEDYITVVIQDNSLMINIDNTVFITRLLEGTYLDYKRIIPKDFVTSFTVNREALFNSIERASIVARAYKNSIKLDIKENNLIVSSNTEIGKVEENVLINLKGKDLVIYFNSKYILECLRSISDEFITFNMNSAIAPCVIKPSSENDEDYLYLVLPIKNDN